MHILWIRSWGSTDRSCQQEVVMVMADNDNGINIMLSIEYVTISKKELITVTALSKLYAKLQQYMYITEFMNS